MKTKSYTAKTITKTGGTRTMTPWTNTNTLLGSYSGTIGVKTGSGTEAKYCLVFAATRNGKTIVGTVLASAMRHPARTDAKKLMNYGFATLLRPRTSYHAATTSRGPLASAAGPLSRDVSPDHRADESVPTPVGRAPVRRQASKQSTSPSQ